MYGGIWGQAPFQHRELTSSGFLWDAAAMPEWFLALLLLMALTALGLSWGPLLVAAPLLVLGTGTTLARAIAGGARARFSGRSLRRWDGLRRMGLTTFLHLIQPLARLRGRFLNGLVPWRARSRARRVAWPRARNLQFWRGVNESEPAVLTRLQRALAENGCVVRSGGGYDDWDLEVAGGALGATRLRSCIEWHGENRQLLRMALVPRVPHLAAVVMAFGALLSAWALLDGAALAALILLVGVCVIMGRSVWEREVSMAALLEGVAESVGQIMELTGSPLEPRPEQKPDLDEPSHQQSAIQSRRGAEHLQGLEKLRPPA